MNRKGVSFLIFGLFMFGLLIAVYMLTSMVTDNIKFDKFAGEDAQKLTQLKQISYRQLFSINEEAQEIVRLNKQIYLNSEVLIENEEGKIKVKDYKLSEFLNVISEDLNKKLDAKIKEYNNEITNKKDSQNNYRKSEELINPNIQYSLFYKEGFIYGFADVPQVIKKTSNDRTSYVYWPNFRIKADFIKEAEDRLNKIKNIKIEFLNCVKEKYQKQSYFITGKGLSGNERKFKGNTPYSSLLEMGFLAIYISESNQEIQITNGDLLLKDVSLNDILRNKDGDMYTITKIEKFDGAISTCVAQFKKKYPQFEYKNELLSFGDYKIEAKIS